MLANFKKLDFPLWAAVLLLSLLSLVTLYSLGPVKGLSFFYRQAIFIGGGFLFALLLSFFSLENIRERRILIVSLFALTTLLLVAVLLAGRVVHGARSWLGLGSFFFQPSEFAKFVLIVVLARYFSLRHTKLYQPFFILLSGFYAFVFFILTALQPDMGSAIIIAAIWIGMLLVSGIRLKYLFLLSLGALIVFAVSWMLLLAPYQKARIISFLNPNKDPLGAGYSGLQAKIAIGSGGIFGKGFGRGPQTEYGFLPEPQTDFMFASILESTGLVGAVFILALYGVVLWRLLAFSVKFPLEHKMKDIPNFDRLFSIGVALWIGVQASINIGMNIGLFPITGVPLPFLSYGGSSLISFFIALGIWQSLALSNS